EVEDDDGVFVHTWSSLDQSCNRVGRLKRRNNSFSASQRARRINGCRIGDSSVLGTALICQPGVLRPDCGIVQSSRNRMRGRDLASFIRQHESVRTRQDSGPSARKPLMRSEPSRVLSEPATASASLDANQLYVGILQKRMKEPDRVRSATDTRE